jgi:hypothetical protein
MCSTNRSLSGALLVLLGWMPVFAGTADKSPEGELYERCRFGVFKVMSEQGHGSGFLVDPSGLILTNHHVIEESDYLAVKIDEHRKYAATLVADDPRNDLAVLLVNPTVIEGLPSLPLVEDAREAPSVSIGDHVLAIGSPLSTEAILTTGIVSKVEDDVLFSDVNINPGNSGGPLLDFSGRVVGVNTFGLGGGQPGPGVSGIVRIFLARDLIDEARARVAKMPLPSDRLLPVVPDYRLSLDELRRLSLLKDYSSRDYHLESGKIDVQFITPLVLAALEVDSDRDAVESRKRRTKKKKVKEYEPGKDFYEWRRYSGDYRPVVRIQAIPEIKMTGGSTARLILGVGGPPRFRFKTDFDRMELYRGKFPVEPIYPGRPPQVIDLGAIMEDLSYFGYY